MPTFVRQPLGWRSSELFLRPPFASPLDGRTPFAQDIVKVAKAQGWWEPDSTGKGDLDFVHTFGQVRTRARFSRIVVLFET